MRFKLNKLPRLIITREIIEYVKAGIIFMFLYANVIITIYISYNFILDLVTLVLIRLVCRYAT